MLLPRLQEIKDKIEQKKSHLRSEKEKELLAELKELDKLNIGMESISESVKSHTQITSGPGGLCPCCGK